MTMSEPVASDILRSGEYTSTFWAIGSTLPADVGEAYGVHDAA